MILLELLLQGFTYLLINYATHEEKNNPKLYKLISFWLTKVNFRLKRSFRNVGKRRYKGPNSGPPNLKLIDSKPVESVGKMCWFSCGLFPSSHHD